MKHSIEQKMKGEIELFMYKMKMSLFVVSVCCVVFGSGCASKQDTSYYNRAIKASEKAHERFDRE